MVSQAPMQYKLESLVTCVLRTGVQGQAEGSGNVSVRRPDGIRLN